jgi:hypothetical protein
VRLHLPEAIVQAASSDDVGGTEPLADLLELWKASETAFAVDREMPLPAADDELDLLPRGLDLGYLDPAGRHGPEIAAAPNTFCAIRRVDRFFDRLGKRPQGVVRFLLVDEEIPVRESDEVHLVALEPARLGRGDRVPQAGPRDAVDSDRAPVRARVDRLRVALGEIVETSLACELLVDRLAPEDHCGSISP